MTPRCIPSGVLCSEAYLAGINIAAAFAVCLHVFPHLLLGMSSLCVERGVLPGSLVHAAWPRAGLSACLGASEAALSAVTDPGQLNLPPCDLLSLLLPFRLVLDPLSSVSVQFSSAAAALL